MSKNLKPHYSDRQILHCKLQQELVENKLILYKDCYPDINIIRKHYDMYPWKRSSNMSELRTAAW